MFGLPRLKKTDSNDTTQFRRLYERRVVDTCVGQIGETVYPVENWCEGGVLLGGDSRFLGFHEVYPITLKFRLRDRVLNIRHPARVIRKAGDRTAMQFIPLTAEVRRAFRQVIDDMVAAQMVG